MLPPEWSGADRADTRIDIPPSPRASSQASERRELELTPLHSRESGTSSGDGRGTSSGDGHHVEHQNVRKSGPLGKCDVPFCTECGSLPFEEQGRQHARPRRPLPTRRPCLLDPVKAIFWRVLEWIVSLWCIYHPHAKVIVRWNQVFALSCLMAVFVDPLFFFILSVQQGDFCIRFNISFAIAVTALRSVNDFVYFGRMLLQFRVAYFVHHEDLLTSKTGQLIDDPKKIRWNYLKHWFLVDLLAILPLPQIQLWSIIRRVHGSGGGTNQVKDALRAILLFQYLPRLARLAPLFFGGKRLTFETAWATFVINLFFYLLAGHVVGSVWYLLGLQRINQCLRNTCTLEKSCQWSFLDCGSGDFRNNSTIVQDWRDQSNASSNCLVNATFSYGIYEPVVPVTMERSTIHKYIYSLFWGFLQISTLGGNLVPSEFVGEVLFTFAIIGLGLLLFALLIGNMQNFLQSLGRRQLEMQLRRHDVETWMKRRRVPDVLRRRVRQAARLRWASTRGINEEEILERLPEDLQKEIRRFLCFVLVKKVRLFSLMHDQVLDAICERLHQRLYIDGSEVCTIHAPLERMLFIVNGNLESVGQDGNTQKLSGGDFCGEELLIWCLERAVQQNNSNRMRSHGPRVASSQTVRCTSSVEAFSLEEKDIQYVVENFTRYMRNSRVQGAIKYVSPYFRSLAARRIQAAWWSYKRRRQARAEARRARGSPSR